MNEEEQTQVEEEVATVGNEEEQVGEAERQEENIKELAKFTQEQVNDFVRARLDKYQARLFNRYGVKDRNELDDLIGKSQAYDVMKERYEKLRNDLTTSNEENVFLKNNINPDKYDDVRAYFKGKGIEFNADNFASELATHNEWLTPVTQSDKPKTTISILGNEKVEKPKVDEADYALKLFGLKNFVK